MPHRIATYGEDLVNDKKKVIGKFIDFHPIRKQRGSSK